MGEAREEFFEECGCVGFGAFACDAEVVEPEESEPAAEGGASEDIESIMDDLDNLDL